MAKYFYKRVTKENKVEEGTVSAMSKASARRKAAQKGATVFLVARNSSPLLSREVSMPFSRFSKYDQILFFRNLATMISAGVSLSRSLRVFEEQAKNKKIRTIAGQLANDIENGKALSFSMKKIPGVFSEYLMETVHVGEVTGELSTTLDRISVDLERDYELSRKIKGAMAYPIVIVVVMLAVVTGLTVYVLPQIAQLFSELNAELPLPTRILLAASVFLEAHPWVIPTAAALFTASFIVIRRIKRTRYWLHRSYFFLPILGDMIKEFNLARFFRALESLVKSGVSLVRAVEVAGKTLNSEPYKDAVVEVQPVLLHGGRLTDALRPHPSLFPLETQRIVDVGEKTGKFDEVFGRLAHHFERSLNHKTQILTALIEPILMVTIGILVGGLALSIFLPIYQASTII